MRTAQKWLIRSFATSKAITATVTPSCWATRPGRPLTVRSRIARPAAAVTAVLVGRKVVPELDVIAARTPRGRI
ncbi:hypothetical protein ABZ815_44800 [Nonomuraea sp. NPDC047529]|uniref:hypothetical protein n=1 Tax=Nonomuraea sp. NPDC047529 TaxID=3155623 RepID=UPI003409A254